MKRFLFTLTLLVPFILCAQNAQVIFNFQNPDALSFSHEVEKVQVVLDNAVLSQITSNVPSTLDVTLNLPGQGKHSFLSQSVRLREIERSGISCGVSARLYRKRQRDWLKVEPNKSV